MIVARMVFQAKLGCADELVAGLKENAELMRSVVPGAHRVRILTDLSGAFDTVIQELEFDSFTVCKERMS